VKLWEFGPVQNHHQWPLAQPLKQLTDDSYYGITGDHLMLIQWVVHPFDAVFGGIVGQLGADLCQVDAVDVSGGQSQVS